MAAENGKWYGGRFEAQDEVGQGGMAVVYAAIDHKDGGRWVALKVLLEREGRDTERFAQEAQFLSELSHPGIVRYVEHGVTPDGEHYLAMEWLQGQSLAERLEEGVLTVAQTVTLGARIADALSVAHHCGVIHRDLKPENIFLPDGQIAGAKVLDFGIARRVYEGARVTRVGECLGTPNYMSPEQARGAANLDARADVFSLGCVLFECLTGRPPFDGDTPLSVLAKVCVEEEVNLQKECPGLPGQVQTLLAAMLQKEKSLRPDNAAHVARKLLALQTQLSEGDRRARRARRVSRESGVPPIAMTEAEQRLFSVLMVALPAQEGARDVADEPVERSLPHRVRVPSPTPAGGTVGLRTSGAMVVTDTHTGVYSAITVDVRSDQGLHRLRASLAAFEVKVDRMYDGSLVITHTGVGQRQEHAVNMARCALAVQKTLPQGGLALCTAYSDGLDDGPINRAIERAGWLATGAKPGQICLDEISAQVLDTRFQIAAEPSLGDAGKVLRFEKGLREPPRTVLGKQLPCVGRDRELRNLQALFEECLSESMARSVLVTAPAGGGKSRVRHELMERIADRGDDYLLLIGRAEALRMDQPFAVMGEALRLATNISTQDDIFVQRKRFLSQITRDIKGQVGGDVEVAQMVAFLGEIAGVPFPDEGLPALQSARADAQAMAEQVQRAWRQWLICHLNTHPVVVALEDVHWADVASLHLVDIALQAARERPLFVMGFARPEVDDRFSGVWQDRNLERIHLRPLSAKAGQKMARQVLGDDVDEAQIAMVVERAAGNPFFLEEILRVAASGGLNDPQVWNQETPMTVRQLVQGRLDALGEDGKRILRASSIFGQRFSRGAVASLVQGRLQAEVAIWLKILEEKEIVFSISQRQGREYAFRHALVQDTAYASIADKDKTTGHRAAGLWLERHGSRDAMTLVEHFERGKVRARAAHWCRVGAEQALQANDLLGVDARAERGMRNGAQGATLGLLYLTQGEAAFFRERNRKAETHAQAAQALLHDEGDVLRTRALALAALGGQSRYDEVFDTITAMLKSPVAAPLRPGWVRCVLRALCYSFPARRMGELRGILDAVAAHGLPERQDVHAYWHHAEGLWRYVTGDLKGATESFHQAAAAYAVAGDLNSATMVRNNMGGILVHQWRMQEAFELLENNCQEARAANLAEKALWGGVYGTMEALRNLGRPDEALERCARAYALVQGDENPRVFGWFITFQANLMLDLNRVNEAQELVAQCLKNPQMAEDCQIMLTVARARLSAAQGNLDDALEILAGAESEIRDDDPERLAVWGLQAEALLASHRLDEGRMKLARLRSAFGHLLKGKGALLGTGSGDLNRCLGLLRSSL